jgi:uncharacterized protein (TIGR04168 family)
MASDLHNAIPKLPPPAKNCTRIVCVGDVHDDWNAVDESALRALRPNLVLFVGDYGNENVEIVQRISDFAATDGAPAVAAVLGNRDGFYSMSALGRDNCPYDASVSDRVQQMLDLLQPYNPGYKSIIYQTPTPLSVVGGRPLTWGGPHWKHAKFYRKYFKVGDMDHSSELISDAARTW